MIYTYTTDETRLFSHSDPEESRRALMDYLDAHPEVFALVQHDTRHPNAFPFYRWTRIDQCGLSGYTASAHPFFSLAAG